MKTYAPKHHVSIAVVLGTVLVALSGCPFGSWIILKGSGGEVIGNSVTLASGGTLSLQALSVSSDDVFTWVSSVPEVARVDDSGLVTAVAPGTAVITVTGSASQGSRSVTVAVTSGTSGEGESGEGETGEAMTLTPFSGRFGYALEGPYGFVGTLTKDQLTDAEWKLEGDFNFPTAGYVVEEPVGYVLESYPEQVRISIGVTPPEGMVAEVITPVPVSMTISVSNEATFKIVVITR